MLFAEALVIVKLFLFRKTANRAALSIEDTVRAGGGTRKELGTLAQVDVPRLFLSGRERLHRRAESDQLIGRLRPHDTAVRDIVLGRTDEEGIAVFVPATVKGYDALAALDLGASFFRPVNVSVTPAVQSSVSVANVYSRTVSCIPDTFFIAFVSGL